MRTKSMPMFIVTALCLLVASAPFAQASDKPTGALLTGADLKQLFEHGAVLDWRQPGGMQGGIVLSPFGTAFFQYLYAGGRGAGADVGSWQIVEDTLCLKWKKIAGGRERCFRHYRVDDNAYQMWVPDREGGDPYLHSYYRLRK